MSYDSDYQFYSEPLAENPTVGLVQTLPLEPQPEYTVSTSQDTVYLEPRNKKGHKYVHVSSASLQSQAMFGKELANKVVNAKGTLCRKCQDKKRT